MPLSKKKRTRDKQKKIRDEKKGIVAERKTPKRVPKLKVQVARDVAAEMAAYKPKDKHDYIVKLFSVLSQILTEKKEEKQVRGVGLRVGEKTPSITIYDERCCSYEKEKNVLLKLFVDEKNRLVVHRHGVAGTTVTELGTAENGGSIISPARLRDIVYKAYDVVMRPQTFRVA